MTFERHPDVNRSHGGLLWALPMGERIDRTRLIFSFRDKRQMRSEFEVWVEKEEAQYYWASRNLTKRPSGAPKFRTVCVEVPQSRKCIETAHAFEAVLVSALGNNQILGESAESALYNLFHAHFVEDNHGLSYLNKYVNAKTGDYYAQQRINKYTHYDGYAQEEAREAINGIEDAVRECREVGYAGAFLSELGQRACRLVQRETLLRDAIEAVLLMTEPADIKHTHIVDLIRHGTSQDDRVIAAIIAATTYGNNCGLLGLRACQRTEIDPVFVNDVDAHIPTEPKNNDNRVLKFLKAQFKGQRL